LAVESPESTAQVATPLQQAPSESTLTAPAPIAPEPTLAPVETEPSSAS
jgi:hypothetical protein